MLIYSILFLLSSNAVSLRRDKSILYARIVITILICSFILCINSYSTDFLDKGLGFFGGFYQTSALTQIFHLFMLINSIFIISIFCNLNICQGIPKLLVKQLNKCNKYLTYFHFLMFNLVLLMATKKAIILYMCSTLDVPLLYALICACFYLINKLMFFTINKPYIEFKYSKLDMLIFIIIIIIIYNSKVYNCILVLGFLSEIFAFLFFSSNNSIQSGFSLIPGSGIVNAIWTETAPRNTFIRTVPLPDRQSTLSNLFFPRDDRSRTYSSLPSVWGVNLDRTFPLFNNLGSNREPLLEIANILEYHARVKARGIINLKGPIKLFGRNGDRLIIDYLNSINRSDLIDILPNGAMHIRNTVAFRNLLRSAT